VGLVHSSHRFHNVFGWQEKKSKDHWLIDFSFGLLLSGLWLMELGLSPLKESAYLQSLLVAFSTKPWLGILAGAVFTGIIQSSSATTSLVVAMARQGLMTFSAAVPLVLGANVGTTVTALLASIGTKLVLEERRWLTYSSTSSV